MEQYADVTDTLRLRTLCTAFTWPIGEQYHFVGERHDFWELVIVTEGEVGVTAGEKTSVLQKGEAILHPPMEFHRVWYAGNIPAQILIFSFYADSMPQLTERQFVLPDLHIPAGVLAKIQKSFVLDEGNVCKMGSQPLQCQIALKELELFLLETFNGRRRNPAVPNSRSAANYVRIVRCLEENICNNISVEEIARACNMSGVNAKQTFARYAGMGIRNYFNHLKIERAIAMLREGYSVQETAEILGFSSPNYFSTTFKRITGKNPTVYKQGGEI